MDAIQWRSRGCTPQSAFRDDTPGDARRNLGRRGPACRLPSSRRVEFAQREHMPFPLEDFLPAYGSPSAMRSRSTRRRRIDEAFRSACRVSDLPVARTLWWLRRLVGRTATRQAVRRRRASRGCARRRPRGGHRPRARPVSSGGCSVANVILAGRRPPRHSSPTTGRTPARRPRLPLRPGAPLHGDAVHVADPASRGSSGGTGSSSGRSAVSSGVLLLAPAKRRAGSAA